MNRYKLFKVKFLSTAFLLALTSGLMAQKDIPVIKASSKIVDIRDGIHYKKGYWIIMPERKPDYYYTELPRKDHQVTFITDMDSITFNVSFGKTYDFIILLNGKDSCYTRISATYKDISAYTLTKTASPNAPDTIPFIMRGSRIYFEGAMNRSNAIIFQFDLGAGMSNINYRSVGKTRVKFDGKTNLINSDGSNEAPTSSSNTIEIAGLKWEDVPFVQTRNMDDNEDAIIGNSLFEEKVIEINYDTQTMVLHDTLPPLPEGYTGHEVIYEEHRPHIKADLIAEEKTYSDWFIFDTGWDGTMVLRDGFFRKNTIWDKLKGLPLSKQIKIIPHLVIGGKEFTNVLSPADNPHKVQTGKPNILGNELLNHFNVFIDNQNGFIYLMPNTLQGNRYENWDSYKTKAFLLVIAIFAAVMAIYILVRKRKEKRISSRP